MEEEDNDARCYLLMAKSELFPEYIIFQCTNNKVILENSISKFRLYLDPEQLQEVETKTLWFNQPGFF